NSVEGPFYIVFTNQLAGIAVPDMNEWSNQDRNVTGTFASVAGSARAVATTEGTNAVVLNGGLLRGGTECGTTGGRSVLGKEDPQNARLDSQIFAEGGPRNVKAVSFAELGNVAGAASLGTTNYRLGGRREFNDTNSLIVSQSQFANTPFPPTI